MTTTRTGLVGWPVAHSLSPRIHAYWIAEHGLHATYELFPTPPETLQTTLAELQRSNVKGVNVTVPHKQAVMQFLDAFDPTVQRIGAVNTLSLREGIFHCTNTDAYGFIHNLQSSPNWHPDLLKNVVLLGAGGATRAAVVALREAGCDAITLCNRTDATAQQLAQEFHVHTAPWHMRAALLADATLLVNTTSLGMQGKPQLEIDLAALPRTALVHDIVYAPLVTPLLAAARVRGNPTVDGLGMLLYQAQAAFAQWHGITPEVTPQLRTHVLSHAGDINPFPISEPGERAISPRSGAED